MARLTARQTEILAALVTTGGGSNKEIARALGITEMTVKHHMRDIFRLLSVGSRTAAAAWYRENYGSPL